MQFRWPSPKIPATRRRECRLLSTIEPIRLSPDLPEGPRPGLRVAEHRGRAVFTVDTDRLVAAVLALSA